VETVIFVVAKVFLSGVILKRELPDGDPAVNDGNFRALLRLRIDAGDVALKEHLQSSMRNTTYISQKNQNEIVASCGDKIV
jgi:hypothetical protein